MVHILVPLRCPVRPPIAHIAVEIFLLSCVHAKIMYRSTSGSVAAILRLRLPVTSERLKTGRSVWEHTLRPDSDCVSENLIIAFGSIFSRS